MKANIPHKTKHDFSFITEENKSVFVAQVQAACMVSHETLIFIS